MATVSPIRGRAAGLVGRDRERQVLDELRVVTYREFGVTSTVTPRK